MSQIIQATIRSEQGTGASRRLRHENKVPAVVYGLGEAQAIVVDHKEMYFALQKENFFTQVLKLNIDGKEQDVIVRDYQMHPVKRQVQHIDFQAIDVNKPVRIKLPIHIVNAEKSQLDCEKVVAGDILHLTDITYPAGVESVALKRNSNLAVATVTGKKR